MTEKAKTEKLTSFRDFEWYKKTSSGWFDGQIKYMKVFEGDDPEEGDLDCETLHLDFDARHAYVRKQKHFFKDILGPKHYSIRIESERVETFEDFDKFMESEYAAMALDKWGDGMKDSSFLDSGEAEFDDRWVYMAFDVADTYKDWLGNTRVSKTTRSVAINVERQGGYFEISVDGKTYGLLLDELVEAIELRDRISAIGLSVTDEGITIPFSQGGEE